MTPVTPVPRSSRRRLVGGLLAVAVLWLFSGVVPVWQYVDARAVPAGADVQPATVTGFTRATARPRVQHRGSLRGKVVSLELPDGSTEPMALAWRWDYPEVGDVLQVHRTADGLASPTQASLVQLLFGVVMLLAWPAATLGYLRARRRTTRARAARAP